MTITDKATKAEQNKNFLDAFLPKAEQIRIVCLSLGAGFIGAA
jgi:hypothetical protein